MIMTIIEKITYKSRAILSIDNALTEKSRKVLSYFFGTVSIFLFITTALIELTTFELSTGAASILSFILSFFCLIPGINISEINSVQVPLLPYTNIFNLNLISGMHFWNGIMLGSLIVYILIKLIDLYINSLKYSNSSKIENNKAINVSFQILKILSATNKGDIIKSFFESEYGIRTANRLSICECEIQEFISSRSSVIDYSNFVGLYNVFTLDDLSKILLRDISLKGLLSRLNISDEDFMLSISFIQKEIELEIDNERYFGRQSLSKWPRIGERLYHSFTHTLDRYAPELEPAYTITKDDRLSVFSERMLSSSENNLAANFFLISDSHDLALMIINRFTVRIGSSLNNLSLRDKRVRVFDTKMFLNQVYSAESFEAEFISSLKEAEAAKNIILVIPASAILIEDAKRYGFDIFSLLEPFLKSEHLQLVCIFDTQQKSYESEQYLPHLFNEIIVNNEFDISIERLLVISVNKIEKKYGITFTIQSIKKVINSCKLFDRNPNNIDDIQEVLLNVASFANSNCISIVKDQDIDKFISLSSCTSENKFIGFDSSKIIKLEQSLLNVIVGQDNVISKVISSLNNVFRTRTYSSKKPFSLLLLGKEYNLKIKLIEVLSESFFGKNNKFLYLNLKDFRDIKSLSRLIGTLGGKEGILTEALSEVNKGIIFFDELHLAHSSVQQLIYEMSVKGLIHGASGVSYDCSNLVIVCATSQGNTESLNYENMKEMMLFEDKIINQVKNNNLIQTKLFNSFDCITVFFPPYGDDLREIAKSILESKSKALNSEGIIFTVNEYVVGIVVNQYVDSLPRITQIEQNIEKIIMPKIREKVLGQQGNIIKHIEFSIEDFI